MDLWLSDVLGLFRYTLAAVMGVPALRFFLASALFFSLISFFAGLSRVLRNGRV